MHEVLADRFFQDRAEPAWHKRIAQGIDPDRRYSAAEAYALIGTLDVRKVKLVTENKMQSTGLPIPSPYFGILRAPIPEDNEPRWFGTVSEDYVLVTPGEIVALWDEHVQRHVQTMMHLRDGKLMVISSKLDGFQVRGEEVDNYVMIGNWMDGMNASTAHVSSVTPVCMNTWRMAGASAVETYRFVHDGYIQHRMGEWFKSVVARAEQKLPVMKEAMSVMASYTLTQPAEEVKFVLERSYPYPSMPKYDPLAPPEYNEKRQTEFETAIRAMDRNRVTAFDLFRGSGTGMRTQARLGTAWGLYQAVVEVEDYRKGSAGDGLAASVLFGDRATCKDRAFIAGLQVATQQAALA
jgi:hypothetical protein